MTMAGDSMSTKATVAPPEVGAPWAATNWEATVKVTGKAAGRTLELAIPVVLPDRGGDGDVLARLWARRRMGELIDALTSGIDYSPRDANVADRRSFLISELLEEEKARTHALLHNVLPAEIAEKLRSSNEAIATNHPAITVLFADIVNFTPYAASHPASEVVGFLNDLFTRFDDLVAKSGLEKIKTVGDAYMFAGGLPSFRPDHLAAIADLALEMRGAAAAAGADVRFGIHTGPAIAGVLGTKRYMYDIWGATVNLAARLESTSRAGEIQVSQEVRDALASTHEFKEQGSVELKGVGPTDVFVLVRRTAPKMEIT